MKSLCVGIRLATEAEAANILTEFEPTPNSEPLAIVVVGIKADMIEALRNTSVATSEIHISLLVSGAESAAAAIFQLAGASSELKLQALDNFDLTITTPTEKETLVLAIQQKWLIDPNN